MNAKNVNTCLEGEKGEEGRGQREGESSECGSGGAHTISNMSHIFIWGRELNLPVNTSRPEEGGVKDVYPVGSHDDLDVLGGLKPI